MLASESLRDGRRATVSVSLDSLIPADHMIRKIDSAIDWQACCAPMRACYSAERGRPAFEPEMLLAFALLRHIYEMDSLRAAAAEMQTNLVYRWFIGCPLDENVPHFSTISANMLHRIPADVFEEAFAKAISYIIDAGVMRPEQLIRKSPFLREGGLYEQLCTRYFLAASQISFAIAETETEKPASAGQIRMDF